MKGLNGLIGGILVSASFLGEARSQEDVFLLDGFYHNSSVANFHSLPIVASQGFPIQNTPVPHTCGPFYRCPEGHKLVERVVTLPILREVYPLKDERYIDISPFRIDRDYDVVTAKFNQVNTSHALTIRERECYFLGLVDSGGSNKSYCFNVNDFDLSRKYFIHGEDDFVCSVPFELDFKRVDSNWRKIGSINEGTKKLVVRGDMTPIPLPPPKSIVYECVPIE
jgi:hypothetical protein